MPETSLPRWIPWRLSQLDPAQRQVIALVAKGMTDDEVGEHLHMTIFTISRHIRRIADIWKQPPFAKAALRIRIALIFMLAEGHLKRIDWPVPELENALVPERESDLEKREAVLDASLTGGLASAPGAAELRERYGALSAGGQRWVMRRLPPDLVDVMEPPEGVAV